jgi:hypothetical protein
LDSESHFAKGDFKGSYETVTSNLNKWKADFSKMRLHNGFFSRTLVEQLRHTEEFPPVSICVIDVDLYQSCVPCSISYSTILWLDRSSFSMTSTCRARTTAKARGGRLIEFRGSEPGIPKKHLFDYGWEGAAFRGVVDMRRGRHRFSIDDERPLLQRYELPFPAPGTVTAS